MDNPLLYDAVGIRLVYKIKSAPYHYVTLFSIINLYSNYYEKKLPYNCNFKGSTIAFHNIDSFSVQTHIYIFI